MKISYYIDKNITESKTIIFEDRAYIMGIAMLLVIVYHFVCWVGFGVLLFPFRWGYIGVDIFLFLSAIGLCFSYPQYSYKEYIKRRIVRIMPLYILAAIVDSCFYIYTGQGQLNLWDWFCNLTSLSFYNIGGFQRDWYLSSLLLLYIIFPVLYKLVNKYTIYGVLVSLLIALFAVGCISMNWRYNCLISRIPIFLFGIYTFNYFQNKYSEDNYRRIICIASMLGVLLLGLAMLRIVPYYYLSTALIAPIFVCIISSLYKLISKKILYIIQFVGKYSLEFYIANIIVHCIVDIIPSIIIKAVVYIITNILLAFILIPVNKFCRRILI